MPRKARRTPSETPESTTPLTPAGADAPIGKLENVSLSAKLFQPAPEMEFDCTVTELTDASATIAVSAIFAVAAELVLYIDGFDRFSVSVLRVSEGVLRVRFHCSPHKRERTQAKIAAWLRGVPLSPVNSRRTSAVSLSSARMLCRANGTTADFDVIDISLLGASLRTRCRPPIGEIITIGTTEGRVARYVDGGIVIEFIRAGARSPAERQGGIS